MSRTFGILSKALLMALLCVLFVHGAAAAQPLKDRRGRPLHVGLQLYSVRDDCAKDLPGVLKAVAAMGYTGVEFAGYYGRTAEELRRTAPRLRGKMPA